MAFSILYISHGVLKNNKKGKKQITHIWYNNSIDNKKCTCAKICDENIKFVSSVDEKPVNSKN